MKKICLKYSRIINALILSLLPITVCLLRALVARQSLFDVWFCGSNWQDELFYYQMTSGVVHHGIPQGYFGYNEVSAQFLSFGFWSPFLLIFWTIWGVIFGWTVLSPVVCNIVLLSIVFFVFSWIVRPKYAQTFAGILVIALFTPISRYLMSCMPEISVLSVIILLVAFWYACLTEYRVSYMIAAYILFILLVLMRPYFASFIIIPFAIELKKRKTRAFISLAVLSFSMLLYVLITKYWSSPYFTNEISLSWVTDFFDKGIVLGFANLFDRIAVHGKEAFSLFWPGVRYGEGGAAYYGMFIAITAILLFVGIKDIVFKRQERILSFSLALINIIMLLALILMYPIGDGSRHLFAFIAADCMIVFLKKPDKSDLLSAGILSVVLLWIFVYKGRSIYFYHVSFKNEGAEYVEDIASQVEGKMVLEKGLTWDNTVIWVSVDYVEDEDTYYETVWRMLYGIPEGFGLNICTAEHVMNSIDNIKSGYIATVPNGIVAKAVEAKNAEMIAQNEFFVLYDIRNMK